MVAITISKEVGPKTRSGEGALIYSDMNAETGFTVFYAPHDDGSVDLNVRADGEPDIAMLFGPKRIDEAHILYMESTELLRSRAHLKQSHAQIRAAEELLFSMFRGEKVTAEQIAAVSVPRPATAGTAPVNKPITVDGTAYDRLLIKSRLITTADKDLLPVIVEYADPHVKPGDILFVSEKALSITQQKIIDMSDIKPTWLAYLFARNVANYYGTADFRGFGHGTPLAMQVFIREAGYPRALFAAAVAAITRPLGIRGAFYYLCGKRAKSVDLPMSFLILEYAHAAKLAPDDSNGFSKRVKARLGCEVVILDSNYRGAFSLGKSTRAIKETFIEKVFAGNPMGQSDEMTPFCIVRKSQ